MFQSPRYITRGVQSEIPIALQCFLWDCIDRLPEERDYLQVFELRPIGMMQGITHRSEAPEHHMEYLLLSDAPISSKLYVIDSGEYSTMLLAEEY